MQFRNSETPFVTHASVALLLRAGAKLVTCSTRTRSSLMVNVISKARDSPLNPIIATIRLHDMGSQRRFDESTSPCTTKCDAEFEVSFTTDHPRCPKNISIVRKWCIVIAIATTSLCVACASSLFTGTITQLEDDFGSSRTVTTLGLSTFVLGLALGPMILAPLSEVRKGEDKHL